MTQVIPAGIHRLLPWPAMRKFGVGATTALAGRLARKRLRTVPRPIPHVRSLRTSLRAAHLIAMASLYGGHIYGVDAERLVPALVGTLATGGGLLVLEVVRTPVWLVQIRGLATLGKLALVAGVALCWEWRLPLLTLALVIGAVVSHMPGRWRYYSIAHGRPIGPEEKG